MYNTPTMEFFVGKMISETFMPPFLTSPFLELNLYENEYKRSKIKPLMLWRFPTYTDPISNFFVFREVSIY